MATEHEKQQATALVILALAWKLGEVQKLTHGIDLASRPSVDQITYDFVDQLKPGAEWGFPMFVSDLTLRRLKELELSYVEVDRDPSLRALEVNAIVCKREDR